jgi:tRNA threonylcarbamoyladenosine biosynthesis protein TsaB
VLLLALDTCDFRGSVALLDDRRVLDEVSHPAAEEYSSWLLPAIDQILSKNSVSHSDLAGYAVASGPGSFTGVRVGLTTLKAWAEVYSKPIFPVSRLTVLAEHAPKSAHYAATFIDAQRKQIFAALHRRETGRWNLVGDECVINPVEFFNLTADTVGSAPLSWISVDPELLTSSSFWQSRSVGDAAIIRVNPPLASAIGLHAFSHLLRQGTDALGLDANYVRRSDAEIFGKKATGT